MPPPSPASGLSFAGGTIGHAQELDSSLLNLPSIHELTIFRQSLLMFQAMPETRLPPPSPSQIHLHPVDCQQHILQLSATAFYLVQTLSLASSEPLSADNVNVRELSCQLVKLAESFSFVQAEVQYQLRSSPGDSSWIPSSQMGGADTGTGESDLGTATTGATIVTLVDSV